VTDALAHERRACRILIGDARERLAELPAGSVRCIVTSPPYFGLRDYGMAAQIGQEPTPDAFVAELVAVFREARRVLADDGTLWLNIGDSYAGGASNGGQYDFSSSGLMKDGRREVSRLRTLANAKETQRTQSSIKRDVGDAKPKDLLGIPWRVAFALQADGWYLRQDIIWHKPNPMPESVRDRCTKAHEYVFLLSKSARYFFDAGAIGETAIHAGRVVKASGSGSKNAAAGFGSDTKRGFTTEDKHVGDNRNRRSVWSITTQPFAGAHFATMPPRLAELCILAGSAPGDTVLDPFGGAGTTGLMALKHSRRAVLIELNPEYAAIARERVDEEERQPRLDFMGAA